MFKDGKIFGKINIIDFLVLILVVVFALAIVIRVGGSKTKEITNKVTFEYVVKVDDIRDYTVQALEKKGDIFEYTNNVKIGEITQVVTEPYKAEGIKNDGTRVFAEVPGKFTAYVTVRSEGTLVDGVYYDADKTDIGVGRGHKVCSKYVSTNGAVVSVGDINADK